MTRSSSRSSNHVLKFKKSIVSTIDDPISSKELLVRLQTLSDELSAVDQETVDLASYSKVSKDLADKKLLGNSNMGIQAYACCCISDILRINAPNAPYTATELSLIFKAFFRQFRKLSNQENPFFQQQCYVLRRLAEVRSIILITDIPDSENLIDSLFETLYGLTSRNFPSSLEPLAGDILSEIVAESEFIPHKVLKIILDKFLTDNTEAASATTKGKVSNPGLNFSIQICESNMDRMSRLVAQMFSEMLCESTENQAGNTDSTPSKLNASKTFESLLKIHKLYIQIWKYAPELLSSIMGLIDDELNVDDEDIRLLATETIGRIIGSTNSVLGISTSKVNFFVSHKETWTNWLKKTSDISPAVRVKWVNQIPHVLSSASFSTTEVIRSLVSCFLKCLLDSDESVRLATCRSIDRISFESFTNKLCNKDVMNTLFLLTREKHTDVRNQSVRILGSLFDQYMKVQDSEGKVNFGGHSEEESSELEEMFYRGIPNQVMSLLYINDKSINAAVDIMLFEKLLPVTESNSIYRVRRLLKIYQFLNDKDKKSFFAINRRQVQISKVLRSFIEESESYRNMENRNQHKENISDEDQKDMSKQKILLRMDKIIRWLCTSLPEGRNAYDCLEHFFKLGKARFLFLMETCISPDSDYLTVKNSLKELLTKLSDVNQFRIGLEKPSISSVDMVSTFKLLMFRSSVLLYNKSNVIELIKFSKDTEHHWSRTANELLEHISSILPDVFQAHVISLTELIVNKKNVELIAYNLKTIYHFICKFRNMFPKDLVFSERLKELAISGTPIEAKYAMKLLGLSNEKELSCQSITEMIYPFRLDDLHFATHLASLAEIYMIDPLAIDSKSSEITSLLIKEIFLKNRHMSEEDQDNGWIDDVELEQNFKLHVSLTEKLLGIRILVNKLKSFDNKNKEISEKDREVLLEQAQPVFKLLVSFIGNRGEIINKSSPSWPTPELYKSRLRISAGLSILKLAKRPLFNSIIYPTTIRRLSFLVTDPNINVRRYFLANMQKALLSDSISERFLPVLFFTANEVEKDLKENSIMWIRSLYKRAEGKSSIVFEKSIVRLIHVISQYEQFVALVEQAEDEREGDEKLLIQAYLFASKFISYFVELIAKSENVSLLYYFASRVKQHRDISTADENYKSDTELPREAINLYRVSELAQLIIKEYSDQKSWSLQTWPGKLKLPTDTYVPISNARELQSIITRVFIPDNIQIELKASIRGFFSEIHKKRGSSELSGPKSKVPKIPRTKVGSKKLASRMILKKKLSKSKGMKAPSRKSERTAKRVDYREDSAEEDPSDDADSI